MNISEFFSNSSRIPRAINARSLAPEPEENETQALQGYLHIGITNNVKMFAATMIQASLSPQFDHLPRVGLCGLRFGSIRGLAALGSGSAGLELYVGPFHDCCAVHAHHYRWVCCFPGCASWAEESVERSRHVVIPAVAAGNERVKKPHALVV